MKKKYLYLLLFLPIGLRSFGQEAHVFHLDKLSRQDTLLTGWVFHAGDDLQWANPAYDDSKWGPANPGEDIFRTFQLKNSGTGWIRLHIRVDSNITNRQLTAVVKQYSASEIYLNGHLICRYGLWSADPSKVKGYLPPKQPFFIHLKPGTDNALAVRLAYEPGLPYVSNFFLPLPAFSMYLNDYPAAISNYNNDQHEVTSYIILISISSGILFIISFIYFAYFLFDRSIKVNLYYSLFTLMLGFNALPNEAFGIGRFGDVASQMLVFDFGVVVLLPGMIFFMLTLYALFDYPYRTFFKFILAVDIAFAAGTYFGGTPFYIAINIAFPFISLVHGVYVCTWAIKRHKKDAVIILGGVVLFTAFNLTSSFIDQDALLPQLLFYGGMICFPIGMSFYLGAQTSLTNKKLELTLAEVQTLSDQKQQILADQNVILEQQVTERTKELNTSLADLKSTQTQLVQSEKMASLGELTAGIAHEIQNPLNFVNNFSEVNREMLEELKAESTKPKAERDEQLEIELINDLIENEQKINHHGKRADSIVKGMLEHSRVGTGEKQPTDLNALADEFLKLSYHGLRAKDKAFNADIITNFDSQLPKMNVAQQDIGRVLVNVFNNAFYAVNQKSKTAGNDYKPTVEVTSFYLPLQGVGGLKVHDNGNGIPEAIKDKIMQPFFTTKPTGEGTGLGLSLSYDIVVKGHGGSITVDTREREFTEFIINLPI